MVSETSASSFPWKVVVGSAVAVGGAYVLYKTFGADETAANPRTPAAAAAAAAAPLSSKSSSQPHSAGVTAAVPPPPVEKEERPAPPSAPAVPAEQSHVPPPPPPEKKESLGLQTAPSAPAVPVPVLRAQRTHPCPTCAVYEDDVKVDGIEPGMCFACGLLICGKCIPKFFATKGNKCPACKAAVAAPPAEQFAKLLDLVKNKPAGRHSTLAHYSLGNSYYHGHGCSQDYAKSVKWHTLAASAGSAASQHDLGIAYDLGHGVQKDHSEAVRWWTKAAEAGLANSQADPARAVRFCNDAADLGCAPAQYNLGVAYLKGEGVGQDVMLSIKWLKKAALQGDEDAKRLLKVTVEPAIRADAESGNQQAVEALRLIRGLVEGATVEVFGLTSAAGQALNGTRGVVAAGKAAAGRTPVSLAGTVKPKAIRDANLKVV